VLFKKFAHEAAGGGIADFAVMEQRMLIIMLLRVAAKK
jgi:hypothetical protein